MTRTSDVTIVDALRDPQLFGPFLRDPATWRTWFVFLRALFALPMDDEDAALYQRCTGRATPPTESFREAWLVCGRRSGKSYIAALVAVFLAVFYDWRPYLAPGERGVVMCLAADRKQARVILRYIKALLQTVELLRPLVAVRTAERVDLTNGITIEVHTASFRSVRGYTVVAALCDEVAFWNSDEAGANPDKEIVAALRPAMATVPTALLLGLSSPHARRGVLAEAHRDHYGQDGSPVLVWQAPTEVMNPTIDPRVIADAYARDPVVAASEYGAQFRNDIAAFLEGDWVERAAMSGRSELSPRAGLPYTAFADPSGGTRDAFTCAIAHAEEGTYVLDVCRAVRPPFDPTAVVGQFARLLKCYGLHRVTGDRYAGEWVTEAFAKEGIAYEHSERTKSEIYLEGLPLFAQGAVQLLDNRALLTELHQLERRTARGGKDSVDHPPGGHDDLANAACGALVGAALGSGRVPTDAPFISDGAERAGRSHMSAFDEAEQRASQPHADWDFGTRPLDW